MKKNWMFIAGPGDVVGTYRFWKDGKPDPRVPTITYSGQLYELAKEHDATLTVVHAHAGKEELEDGPFRFVHLDQSFRGGALGYFWSQFKACVNIARIVRRHRPDFVLYSSNAPELALRFFPFGTLRVLTMHNTIWPMGGAPKPGLKNRLRLGLAIWGLRTLNGAVCTSLECQRQLEALLGPNSDFRVQRPVMSTPIVLTERSDRVRHIVYLGRVEENKGIFMLLQAFEALADKTSDLSLQFIGDGSALEKLRARIAASRHGARISTTGRLLAEEVHGELSRRDLLVCPTKGSFLEGLAMVGLEAACHGVPSLLSSVVPASDILGEACAVFRVDDQADLLQKLGAIVDDPEDYARMVAAAQALNPVLQDPSEAWGVQLGRILEKHLT